MADSSSSFTQLGALPASLTTAGLFFTQSSNPPATQAWWNFDGTNLNGNVPTGGYNFEVNGITQASISTAGTIGGSSFTTLTNGDWAAAVNNGATEVLRWINASAVLRMSSGFGGFSDHSNNIFMKAGAIGVTPTSILDQVSVAHVTGGSSPLGIGTCLIGLGAGTTSSGTNVTASGHDMAARVGVTVNSTGTVSQPILLVSFAQNYASPPFMSMDPGNAATASIALTQAPFIVSTVSGYAIMANTTGLAAGTYVWYVSGICQ